MVERFFIVRKMGLEPRLIMAIFRTGCAFLVILTFFYRTTKRPIGAAVTLYVIQICHEI